MWENREMRKIPRKGNASRADTVVVSSRITGKKNVCRGYGGEDLNILGQQCQNKGEQERDPKRYITIAGTS